MKLFQKLKDPKNKCIHISANDISVFEKKPFRWVEFNKKYIQTMINLNHPHKPILPYLRPLMIFSLLNPGDLLLLGLGGGGLIHVLKKQQPDTKITVIEKYDEMIKIAKKFFLVKEDKFLKIVNQSADVFLSENTSAYQHIIIDLGDKDGFPISCFNLDFFINAHKALKEDGIIVLNLPNHHEIESFKPLFIDSFGAFPLIIYAEGNWILVATKMPNKKQKVIELLKKNYLLKSYEWDNITGAHIHLNTTSQQFIKKHINKLLSPLHH
jgi:spermidine synthase